MTRSGNPVLRHSISLPRWVRQFTSSELICLNVSNAHVWQRALIQKSYFGINITGPLACHVILHKTNTFLAVNGIKSEGQMKASSDLTARYYMDMETRSAEEHTISRHADHTYSALYVTHPHTVCIKNIQMQTVFFSALNIMHEHNQQVEGGSDQKRRN